MKIILEEFSDGEQKVVEIGDIRITGYLSNGKTILNITCLKGGDFVVMQPQSGNSITVKADKTIKF